MSERLSSLLDMKVSGGASFVELHEILRAFAHGGGTKDEAELIISEMRKHDRPQREDDVLLDLLDVVTGFCQPKWRIWLGD